MNRLLQATIPRRQRQCAGCLKSFTDKQEYHSTLGNEENGVFLRRDFCISCFSESCIKEKPAVAWKGIVTGTSSKKVSSEDRTGQLLELLKEVQGKPDQAADAFFIALYLARKKAIIFRHEIMSQAGKPLWIYEVTSTEEMITIEKVPLRHLQSAQLQKEVLDLLQKKSA